MSRYTETLALTNDAMGDVYGEPFFVDGVEYQAQDIGDLQSGEKLVTGGKYNPGTLKITVLQTVLDACGLGMHKILNARGSKLRVEEIVDEGDNAKILICGPAGVNPKIGGRR